MVSVQTLEKYFLGVQFSEILMYANNSRFTLYKDTKSKRKQAFVFELRIDTLCISLCIKSMFSQIHPFFCSLHLRYQNNWFRAYFRTFSICVYLTVLHIIPCSYWHMQADLLTHQKKHRSIKGKPHQFRKKYTLCNHVMNKTQQ